MAQETKDSMNTVGSIKGRITIQGKPASGLEVSLLPQRNHIRDKALASTKTDEGGCYRFAGLQSNHYWLKVLAPQYINLAERDDEGPGRRISLAYGASVENADLDLTLGGTISGRVVDSDGNPVASESVELIPVTDYGPGHDPVFFSEEFETDQNGDYRIYGIPPGRYLISIGVETARVTGAVRYKNDWGAATGRVGSNQYYEQTYYPGVTKREIAQAIDITAGSEINDIDLIVGRASRAYSVSGRVVDALTGNPVRDCHIQVGYLYAGSSNSSHSVNGPTEVDERGHFSFSGFLPGRFYVNAVFSGESDLYGKRVDFEVKEGDVAGIVIKAYRGLTARGTVVIEGTPPADALAKRSQLKLKISTAVSNQMAVYVNKEVAVNADGTFKIIGLPRGPIEISAFFCDACEFFAMKRIEYTKADARNEIQVAGEGFGAESRTVNVEGDLQGVRVVLGYKGASILCHVKVIGMLPSNIRLMVLVDSGIGKGGWAGWREVDANGDMLETGLEPGDYKLEVGDGSRRFTGPKRVTVRSNQQTKVTFTVDASKIQDHEAR